MGKKKEHKIMQERENSNSGCVCICLLLVAEHYPCYPITNIYELYVLETYSIIMYTVGTKANFDTHVLHD